jgi:hypothetical protein
MYRYHSDGYTVAESSTVLPGVTGHQLTQFVEMGYEMPRPAWLRQVRTWAESLPQDPEP